MSKSTPATYRRLMIRTLESISRTKKEDEGAFKRLQAKGKKYLLKSQGKWTRNQAI